MTECLDKVCRSRALPSFLDANSIGRIAIDVYIAQDEERISKTDAWNLFENSL